jgi:hypothetical protein
MMNISVPPRLVYVWIKPAAAAQNVMSANFFSCLCRVIVRGIHIPNKQKVKRKRTVQCSACNAANS